MFDRPAETDWSLCNVALILSFLVNEGGTENDAALPDWVDWFFDLVLSLLGGITFTLSDEVEDV